VAVRKFGNRDYLCNTGRNYNRCHHIYGEKQKKRQVILRMRLLKLPDELRLSSERLILRDTPYYAGVSLIVQD
jgi:hypothetical protein